MKKMINTLLMGALLSAFCIGTFAESGIISEYKKIMQKKAEAKTSPEKLKAQLEKTLTKSLQNAMFRYHNYRDYLEIVTKDFKYEKSKEDDYTYYIKFKNYIGFFSFRNDPKQYFTYPRRQKLIILPGTKPIKSKNKKK